MATEKYGECEASYRRWVESHGALSPRQETIAQTMYLLAAQMDMARVTAPGSWPAANSRELRQLSARLRDAAVVTPTATSTDSVDEVAAARAARLARGQSTPERIDNDTSSPSV